MDDEYGKWSEAIEREREREAKEKKRQTKNDDEVCVCVFKVNTIIIDGKKIKFSVLNRFSLLADCQKIENFLLLLLL